jgi:hypothetical protein
MLVGALIGFLSWVVVSAILLAVYNARYVGRDVIPAAVWSSVGALIGHFVG